MSCWCRTTVLRIPAAKLGFTYRWQWLEFLKEHKEEFRWADGYFCSSPADDYPYSFNWKDSDFYDPDRLLDQRHPDHPEIVPGPFLDYNIEEISLSREEVTYGMKNASRPLTKAQIKKYLPLYRKLLPDFTEEQMQYVRYCTYEWYDGAEPQYFYS